MADYQIELFNPPPSKTQIPISITYPPAAGLTYPIKGIRIKFSLEASGSIAENVPVSVINATGDATGKEAVIFGPLNYSVTSYDYYPDLTIVAVGFDETVHISATGNPEGGQIWMPWNYWGSGLQGMVFRHVASSPYLRFESEDTFYFSVSGDYSPTIYMTFNNGTEIQHTYEQIKVHVLSASEMQAEKLNRVNTVIAIALLSFAFIEGIKLVKDLTERKHSQLLLKHGTH